MGLNSPVELPRYLDSPDHMRSKTMVVDPDVCSGCQACEMACSLKKGGEFAASISRISIHKIESRSLAVPVLCQHCETSPCRDACPVGAIVKDATTGRVGVDPKRCTGCQRCRPVCPFGPEAIRMVNSVAVMCDLCDGAPACVAVCQQGALVYMPTTLSGLQKKWERAERSLRILASDRIERVKIQ